MNDSFNHGLLNSTKHNVLPCNLLSLMMFVCKNNTVVQSVVLIEKISSFGIVIRDCCCCMATIREGVALIFSRSFTKDLHGYAANRSAIDLINFTFALPVSFPFSSNSSIGCSKLYTPREKTQISFVPQGCQHRRADLLRCNAHSSTVSHPKRITKRNWFTLALNPGGATDLRPLLSL